MKKPAGKKSMRKKPVQKESFVVELQGVGTAEALHAALAAQLPLPAHYGRNLDAFYDVLTECGANWRIVFRHAGAAAAGLRQVCADAAAEGAGGEIVFED